MTTNSTDGIPSYLHMSWPLVVLMRELGGSGTNEEIDRGVIEMMEFTDEQQQVLSSDGRRAKINYRLAWARTHLKAAGILNNSSRSVWALTPEGLSDTENEVSQKVGTVANKWSARSRTRQQSAPTDDPVPNDDISADDDWKAELLDTVWRLTPSGFERLCQRLLREAGFREVRVVGGSGDNGIDVVGTYRVSLISFQTYVQCKRYDPSSSSVGAPDIRNFRGAMRGVGDKGLFITTSRFTRDAGREASRDGVEPIDLIDGDRLCELMKEYGLGTAVEMVEQVSVDTDFFRAFGET